MSDKIKNLLNDGLIFLKEIEETYPDNIKNTINDGYNYNSNNINSNNKEDNYKILKYVYSKILIYLILSNSVGLQNDIFVLNNNSYKYNKETVKQTLKVYNTFSEKSKNSLNVLIEKNINNVKVNIENASTSTNNTGASTSSGKSSTGKSSTGKSSGLDEKELKKRIKFISEKLSEEYSLSNLSLLTFNAIKYNTADSTLNTILSDRGRSARLAKYKDSTALENLYSGLCKTRQKYQELHGLLTPLVNAINELRFEETGFVDAVAFAGLKTTVDNTLNALVVNPLNPVNAALIALTLNDGSADAIVAEAALTVIGTESPDNPAPVLPVISPANLRTHITGPYNPDHVIAIKRIVAFATPVGGSAAETWMNEGANDVGANLIRAAAAALAPYHALIAICSLSTVNNDPIAVVDQITAANLRTRITNPGTPGDPTNTEHREAIQRIMAFRAAAVVVDDSQAKTWMVANANLAGVNLITDADDAIRAYRDGLDVALGNGADFNNAKTALIGALRTSWSVDGYIKKSLNKLAENITVCNEYRRQKNEILKRINYEKLVVQKIDNDTLKPLDVTTYDTQSTAADVGLVDGITTLKTTMDNLLGADNLLQATFFVANYNPTIGNINDLRLLINNLQLRAGASSLKLVTAFNNYINKLIDIANEKRIVVTEYIIKHADDGALAGPGYAPHDAYGLNGTEPTDAGNSILGVGNYTHNEYFAASGGGRPNYTQFAHTDIKFLYDEFVAEHDNIDAYDQVTSAEIIPAVRTRRVELIKYNSRSVINLIIRDKNLFNLSDDYAIRLKLLLQSPIYSLHNLLLLNLIYYYRGDPNIIMSLLNVEPTPAPLTTIYNQATAFNTAYNTTAYDDIGTSLRQFKQLKDTVAKHAVIPVTAAIDAVNQVPNSNQLGNDYPTIYAHPVINRVVPVDIDEVDHDNATVAENLYNAYNLAKTRTLLDNIRDQKVNLDWSKYKCVLEYYRLGSKDKIFKDYLNAYRIKIKELKELQDIKKEYEAELKKILSNKTSSGSNISSSNKTSSGSNISSGSSNKTSSGSNMSLGLYSTSSTSSSFGSVKL